MLNITNRLGNTNQNSMRYRFTPACYKKTVGVGEDVEKKDPSCAVGGNANWCSHSGKQHGSFSEC